MREAADRNILLEEVVDREVRALVRHEEALLGEVGGRERGFLDGRDPAGASAAFASFPGLRLIPRLALPAVPASRSALLAATVALSAASLGAAALPLLGGSTDDDRVSSCRPHAARWRAMCLTAAFSLVSSRLRGFCSSLTSPSSRDRPALNERARSDRLSDALAEEAPPSLCLELEGRALGLGVLTSARLYSLIRSR
eukprot:762639-Hanusia_phi.AAC.7